MNHPTLPPTERIPSQKHRKESGQALIEYALLIVLVAIVIIPVLRSVMPALYVAYGSVYCPLNYGGEARFYQVQVGSTLTRQCVMSGTAVTFTLP